MKLQYYSLSFAGNGMLGQSFAVDARLAAIGLDVRHEYGMHDGSLYKFVRCRYSRERLIALVTDGFAERYYYQQFKQGRGRKQKIIRRRMALPGLNEIHELTPYHKTIAIDPETKRELMVHELF